MKKIKCFPFESINLPNGRNFRTSSIFYTGIWILLMFSVSCSTIRIQREQLAEDKRSNLPQNMKTAEEDSDIAKETSCVISVNDDSGTFFMGKEQISLEKLTEKITEKMKDKTPEKRIVYIEGAVGVKYETIVKLFDQIRKADIDKAGLVAFKEKYEKLGLKPSRFEVRIPAEPKPDDPDFLKPNPLTLVVIIDKNKFLRLNADSMGDASDPSPLTKKLTDIFKDREWNGVFREGTNEIEKTVFIKAAKSLKYGDVVKVIDTVKLAGGQPIGMQVDDLTD